MNLNDRHTITYIYAIHANGLQILIYNRSIWQSRYCVIDRRSGRSSDSLVELTELVHKGERRGMFMDKMPSSIQRGIHSENLTFVKNRDVFNAEYFRFVRNLVARNTVSCLTCLGER